MEITNAELTADTDSVAIVRERPVARRGVAARRAAMAVGVLFLFLIVFLWLIGVFGGNVRTIAPGRAYRSSTLTGFNYTSVTARLVGNDLESVLKRDGIRTVISLRAGSPRDDWYRDELAACKRVAADHKDITFSARKLPPPETLAALLDAFDHAQYPILLHCQAGSDRTGLASALYAHLYEKLPLARAEAEELTWRYGHFPVDKTRAMDDFFTLYRRDANGLDLRTWILKKYPQVYAAKTIGSVAQ